MLMNRIASKDMGYVMNSAYYEAARGKLQTVTIEERREDGQVCL
jgi:hypothetical protein